MTIGDCSIGIDPKSTPFTPTWFAVQQDKATNQPPVAPSPRHLGYHAIHAMRICQFGSIMLTDADKAIYIHARVKSRSESVFSFSSFLLGFFCLASVVRALSAGLSRC